MTNICIFASGNGSNAEAIIAYFSGHAGICVKLIVSSRGDAYVLQRAGKHGIPALVLERSVFRQTTILLDELNERHIDFIVLAGFMWLVPGYVIDAYPKKIVNIHPALLPKYGGKGMYGSHVHEAVIKAGETTGGITIHYVNENYDEGSIISQQSCPVGPKDTPSTLAEKIHHLEHAHYPKVIEAVIMGMQRRSVPAKPG